MKTLQRILSRPKYFFVSIVSAIVVVVIATWLPNFGLIASVLGNSALGLFQKGSLLLSLVGSFQTNFTLFSQVITITTAALVGVQVSLFIYLLRQRMAVQKSVGMSFAGILSSMLGIGCASCGSVILTSLFGLGTTVTVLTFLPLGGQEFGLLGIGLISFVIIWLVRKIEQPIVCEV